MWTEPWRMTDSSTMVLPFTISRSISASVSMGTTLTKRHTHRSEPVSYTHLDVYKRQKYSKWAYADLPIFPMDWQYEVSAGTKKQFGILKKLTTECRICDPDIFRHIMRHDTVIKRNLWNFIIRLSLIHI